MDPETIATRQEFAAALTAARDAAGLTIREVARATGLSTSTVGGYFSGRHLPSLRPDGGVRAVLTACGITDPAELDSWQRTLARIRRPPGPRPGGLPPPYRGLAAYRPEDAEIFFGRDAESLTVADALASAASGAPTGRLAVLLGAAGSGRTSLLQAGVTPRLRAAGHEVRLLTAAEVLADPGTAEAPAGTVLVVDDLDRLPAAAERHAVARRLADRAAEPGGPTVLAVFRTEDARDAARLPGLATGVRRPVLTLLPPDDERLRDVVVGPARRAAVDVDPGVVEAVIEDAHVLTGHGTPPLPRVSHALLATWQEGGRAGMSLAAYRATGGALGSLEAAARELRRSLPGPGAPPHDLVAGRAPLSRARSALAALRRGWPVRNWGRTAPPDER